MQDNIEQLKAIIAEKLTIATEIEDIMHYMEYALHNEDLDLLERSLDDRSLAMDAYDKLEIKYQELVEKFEDKTIFIEMCQPIYDILAEVNVRDKKITHDVEHLLEKSKADMKVHKQSKKATNGYLGGTSTQGRRYDTKK